jgi:predicted enzyme related to lactoylglutathione lyase
MVTGLAFVCYPANDVEGMRRWYEEHLELRFGPPYVEDGVEAYNEADLGNATFGLMSTRWTERPAGSAASAYFEVDDLDTAVASLREKGVTMGRRFDGPACRQVSFCDLEGNVVTIHESLRRG